MKLIFCCVKEKDNEISFLKSKIHDLKNTLEYWKDKFSKLISFLHDKLHSWYDKDDEYSDLLILAKELNLNLDNIDKRGYPYHIIFNTN